MPANKPFGDEINSLGMALSMFSITPHDTNELGNAVRMIYVGLGGDVNLTDSKGNTVLHKNAPTGSYLGPFNVVKVNASNTTASNLIGYV